MYWIQPGGQVLGDQTFDAFSYSDCKDPLQEYTTPWKSRSQNPELAVWATVGISVSGFVFQFVSLRGIHSAICVAQLGAIIVMSAARAALRMQRLKIEDNPLAHCPDEVIGHELDWLALRIGEKDIQSDLDCSSSTLDHRYFWRFCGVSEPMDRIRFESSLFPKGSNASGKLLAYRSRLAQLTESSATQEKPTSATRSFKVEMVEVRHKAEQLAIAIEPTANAIFSQAPRIKKEWKNAKSILWRINSTISSKILLHNQSLSFEQVKDGTKLKKQTLYLHLTHDSADSDSPGNLWKLQDRQELEALLGAAEVPARRIVSSDRSAAEAILRLWLNSEISGLLETPLLLRSDGFSDPSTMWELEELSKPLSSELLRELERKSLLIQVKHRNSERSRDHWQVSCLGNSGWKTCSASLVGMKKKQSLAFPKPREYRVWAVPTKCSPLSLCVQEVFASFFKSIIGLVEDIGSIEIQKEYRNFRLANSLVSEIVEVFTETQLGSKGDAMLCVLPSIISQFKSPLAKGASVAAKNNARQHRTRGGWKQAEMVLKWAREVCIQFLSSKVEATNEGQSKQETFTKTLAEQFATALGELYWFAFLNRNVYASQPEDFVCSGMKWLIDEERRRSSSISDTIFRYCIITNQVALITGIQRWNSLNINSILVDSFTHSAPRLASTEKGDTILTATMHGWAELVLALLELGVEPNHKDQDLRTALSYAAETGDISTLRMLMDQ
ncbi:hypothetical protein AOQ84DRAFT_372031 [Glonium stellatum]|uniref:Uncharacterized protein n=1 Tax=Glonium stellatum TaxID=574774 RepID=A0A8E2FBU8_9PEZI|nr:hypothetical protein AOQ84DRAFT_372031 [Glonium stellatum]